MTSEDAARDRLIYDDLVRFCGDLRASISSIVARSHTLLSISIAAVIGYFVIFGREVGEAKILELIGVGVFLIGAAFFLHIAFLHVSFDSSRLGWEHRHDSLDDTLYDSVALMVDLAENLTIGHANYKKHYERAIVAWSISWPIGIAIIVLSYLI